MKRLYKKIVSIILVLMLVFSVANELELSSGAQEAYASSDYTISDGINLQAILINAGSSETDLNFTWYANTYVSGVVQMAEASEDVDGTGFPKKIQFQSRSTATPVQYIKGGSSAYKDCYTNKASISGLKKNTKYVYRVSNAGIYSDIYEFEVKGEHTNWSWYYSGDPQLDNTSTNAATNKSVQQWKQTLAKITEFNPNASLLVTGGDLADAGGGDESQYILGLLAPAELKSLAMATTVGNHDQFTTGLPYTSHVNQPNQVKTGSFNGTTGDYWYTYNNVLFIHLTTSVFNNIETSLGYINGHVAFIKEAIEANPDSDWHILVFHEALFSAATHSTNANVISMRNQFVPKLKEIDKEYGIDLVLNAHDHYYSRSYLMDGTTPLSEGGAVDSVTDPQGIFYITANTGSGIKYYDKSATNHAWLAVSNQEKTPNISNIEITGDAMDTSLHITTYRNTVDPLYTAAYDDMSIVDEFTISKTAEKKIMGSSKDLVDSASLFTVTVPNIFSQDQTVLNVKTLTSGTAYNKLTTALSNDTRLKGYNILSSVYDADVTWSGKGYDVEGTTVYIPFPEIKDGYVTASDTNRNPVYNIYTLNDQGNAAKVLNSKVVTKNGIPYIAFESDTVGTYAVGIATEAGDSVKTSVSGGGTVSVLGTPIKGQTITVKTAPNSGREVKTVKVTDENGKTVKVTNKGNSQYAFVMPGTKAAVDVTYRTVAVTKIKITSKSSLTLKKGDTSSIKANVTPSGADVTYSTSNKKVATVSKTGKIKAVGKGYAEIIIKGARGDEEEVVTVNVKQPVTSVKLNAKSTTLSVGGTFKIKATIKPSNASNKKLKYKSSNTSVVKVTSKGIIKAVGKGTAKVTVTAKDGSKKNAKITITVSAGEGR